MAACMALAGAQIVLTQRAAPLGCLPVPAEGFGWIPVGSFTHFMAEPQVGLGQRMALFGGFVEPLGRFGNLLVRGTAT